MTGNELINSISRDTELDREDIDRVMKSLLSNITDAFKRGEDITLPDIGTMHAEYQPLKRRPSPFKNSSIIQVGDKVWVKFYPVKSLTEGLKEAVKRLTMVSIDPHKYINMLSDF